MPEVGVECPLRDVIIDVNLFVFVALTDDSAVALGHIGRSPAYIQMMHGHQQGLDIGACAHLCSAAQQDTHLAAADFGEQIRFLTFSISVVDELDLRFRHPGGKQLCANIIVDIERAVSLGRGHIAENQLRQIILFGFVPDTQNIVDAGIQLAVRVIRGERIHQPLVKAGFTSVRGDLQHIVHRGVNRTAMHLSSTFAQGFHHVLLDLRGFDHDSFKLGFRNRQMQLVGSLDVRCLLEHIHQLRQIKELGKTCARTVAGSFRRKLNGRGGLAKRRSPCIKVGQLFLLESAVLQIAHQGVHFRHGVADGRSRCENHAAPASHFIQITTLAEHIAGLLCFGGRKASNIAHLGVKI